MTEAAAALRRLCEAHGISTGYHDIWGAWVDVPEASLRGLLGELGSAVPDSASIDVQLARARAAPDPIAAVVLLESGATEPRVDVVVPARWVQSGLRWQLIEASGAVREGGGAVSQMPIADDGDRGALAEGVEPRALALGAPLADGYHRLRIEFDGGHAFSSLLIVAPQRCWRPESIEAGHRLWGPSVQLYGLRSQRNWGIGDFSDLISIADEAASRGADLLGLNPLHAMFSHNPAHCSPYSPSSRLALNWLYLDVEAIEDFDGCESARRLVRGAPFQSRLRSVRSSELVDYVGVASLKLDALRLVFRHFRDHDLSKGTRRARAFRRFQRARGRSLRRYALYEALQGHFHRDDPAVWGWPVWPDAYRDPESDAVLRYEGEHEAQIEFFEYLQWQCSEQLERAAVRCEALGMGVGLYMDLAVSVDRAGADTWSFRRCYSLGASVGAPPDDFNLKGQDWGLPPLNPEALRACGYEPFIQALRENMRCAGALRIDHVMGLMRLYWIPPGASAQQGAYVHYRLDEMMAIVALESHRNRCMVIGEDLGTVPAQVREAMDRQAVLSYRLMYFERGDGGIFRSPDTYPRQALAAISTHDLPTLAGWWAGDDLQLREKHALFPTEAIRAAQRAARESDRPRLVEAFARAGWLPVDTDSDATARVSMTSELAVAAHAFVAASPSAVMVVQLEDMLGIREQSNLPGTVDEHPNWRRKLGVDVARLAEVPEFVAIARAVAAARPRPGRVAADPARPAALARLRATYRVQLNSAFGLDDAAAIVPYLAGLGISHLYCSPVLTARAGSPHGYDIVDHSRINPELGGAPAFDRLVATLRRHGMGVLFDMVPNHMGVLGADNAWWMDVLENGPSSRFAGYFDIDWNPINVTLTGKVLVPVLGDQYGLVLERGELVLRFERENGMFAVGYYGHRMPVDPRTCAPILESAARILAADTKPSFGRELGRIAEAFALLPAREADSGDVARSLSSAGLKRELADLAHAQPSIGRAIELAVGAINDPAVDASRDSLHELLEQQAYRLAHWRVAADEINYRRFFDINELAALRMEEPEVFEATHALALDLAARGLVDGLRIDHSDGLFDPAAYFARLQRGFAARAGLPEHAPAGGRPARPLYVLIEKITAGHEQVSQRWAVHGTTGYRFASVVNGLFVDTAARARIDRIWRAFTGEDVDFEEAEYRGKRAIMRSALASELTVLAAELLRIARLDRRTRDYTFNTLRDALAEVAACMPVYRTYIVGRPRAQDRRYVDWAVARATRRSRAADTTIFDFVRACVLGQPLDHAAPGLGPRILRFAMRFQQFTSPVTAKGVEDTAYYRFGRLVSLNEVGSDPDTFGITVRAFHGASTDRARNWPDTMLAGSTHDNKRSDDVRQRINVLSEMPAAWRLLLRRWRTLNRSKRKSLGGEPAPSAADEYLLYQTLLGSFPDGDPGADQLDVYRVRIEQYMLKAAREAKQHTSWISHDERYEHALVEFVRELLVPSQNNPFPDELREQAATLRWFGALNSLAATILRYASPGVPDLYQGDELYDFSLVDPDNRRPVDYASRARLVDEIAQRVRRDGAQQTARAIGADPLDSRAKLFLIWRLLAARSHDPEPFRAGTYVALATTGTHSKHLVAFARRSGDKLLVVVAGRLFATLLGERGRLPTGETWGDCEVLLGPENRETAFTDLLTGSRVVATAGRLRVCELMGAFPGAVLAADRVVPDAPVQ